MIKFDATQYGHTSFQSLDYDFMSFQLFEQKVNGFEEFVVTEHIAAVCCCGPCNDDHGHSGHSHGPKSDGPKAFDVNSWITDFTIDPSEIQSSIPGDITTTANLVVGESAAEIIDFAGDVDWFSVTLTAGETYSISVSSFAHSDQTGLSDAYVSLYNAAGSLITFDDDAGAHLTVLPVGDALLTFTASTTGTYFVGAESSTNSGTGGYAVLVETRAADSVANGPMSATTHAIGTTTNGEIDYNADQDWFSVQLEAGQTYEFIVNPTFPNTLVDSFLSLHNSDGTLISFDDDGGPERLGSRIVYTAEENGTYFVSAQGFTGNSSVSSGTYTLRSGLTEPLTPLDGLDWGTALSTVPNGETTVEVYFAGGGETFDGTTSLGWNTFERAAVMRALNEIAERVNLTFVETSDAAAADFKFLTFDFKSDSDSENDDVLGFFGPPGTGSGSGIGVFGRTAFGWNESGLEKGGYGYVTIIHEIGHGLGLAHPHDTGGTSNTFQGVSGSSDAGDFGLNQGVFTTMSYVDGWAQAPQGTSGTSSYGWQATMMALDLAVLQQKYGARARNEGDTVYDLVSANANGTYWEAIWDTGGIDTISHAQGSSDSIIDLRQATLEYEQGGGGFISYVNGIFGGLTIANGVEIENAVGGSGSDQIIGNGLNNVIDGGAGADNLDGGLGTDTLTFASAMAGVAYNIGTGTGSEGNAAGDVFSNFELYEGSDYGDVITGSVGQDTINGRSGNDTIDGQQGNDTLSGGDGNDTINGGTGSDLIFGNAGDDAINGGDGFETIYGGDGRDTIRGGLQGDIIYGEDGDDILYGDEAADFLFGGAGNDTGYGGDDVDRFFGGSGDDTAFGGNGNDQIRGEDGNDQLNGESGNDTIFGGAGDDTISGGDGIDRLFAELGNDVVNADAGDDVVLGQEGNDQLFGGLGVDLIWGGADNDIIEGNEGNDILRGNDGDDTLRGGDGDDNMQGGSGNNTLDGGAGNDRIIGIGDNDIISGGDGDDFLLSGDGDSTITGGAGRDFIIGGNGVDDLDGGDGNDSLFGQGGDDIMNGGEGFNRLFGGDGTDTMTGGTFIDWLYGGNGNDTMRAGLGDDELYGQGGDDQIFGEDGNDLIRGNDGMDNIEGGNGSDNINGGADDDTISGGDGNDIAFGGDGADFITGDDGNDILGGDGGGDVLIGGSGADTLSGGDGIDVFVFALGDTLVSAADTITDLDAGEQLAFGAHSFIGTSAFSGTGNFEIRYVSGSTTEVQLDRDGDGAVDELINISGDFSFTSDGQELTSVSNSPADDGLII